jgi:hypothetical protein
LKKLNILKSIFLHTTTLNYNNILSHTFKKSSPISSYVTLKETSFTPLNALSIYATVVEANHETQSLVFQKLILRQQPLEYNIQRQSQTNLEYYPYKYLTPTQSIQFTAQYSSLNVMSKVNTIFSGSNYELLQIYKLFNLRHFPKISNFYKHYHPTQVINIRYNFY